MLDITWFFQNTFLKVFLPLLFTLSLLSADTIRIMPLGNSITYDSNVADQANPRPVGDRISYRGSLWAQLVDGGYNFDFVGSRVSGGNYDPQFDSNNEGWLGHTASEIASDMYGYLEGNPADIILLHIGTNGLAVDPSDVNDTLNEVDRYESVNSVHIKVS